MSILSGTVINESQLANPIPATHGKAQGERYHGSQGKIMMQHPQYKYIKGVHGDNQHKKKTLQSYH